MKERHEEKCKMLCELTHRQKSQASAVGEAREGRGLISGKRTHQFSTLSLQPLARIAGLTYTQCSEHIGCHLCRDRVEGKSRRRLRRSFLPNEPGNGSINVLDSQLTRDSDIHSSSKYSTRVKMRQFCEWNHVLLKPKMFFWSATSTDTTWLT